MAEIVHSVIRLLLLCLFRTSVKGEGGQILAEQSNGITYPCGQNVVCFHIWQYSTEGTPDYIAIVSNGEIKTSPALEDEASQCTLQIKEITEEDVGRHHCRRRPLSSSPYTDFPTNPQLNLMPGKTVTLQCILLASLQQGHCYMQLQQLVSLTWVDESGAVIQEDSKQHINQKSACDVTLTVSFQSPQKKKYRCQATVQDQFLTSVEFHVRFRGLKGKGRFMKEQEPENQGGNQDTVGLAVGLVGCAVLSAVAAVFVVNIRRRRKTQPLPKESCHTTDNNNVLNAGDVIYTEIMLPAGSDPVLVHEYESTEYACVRYK
ncbi:uncharacterized protein LOC117824299 [Notolabrus celidotus]|uniref:uncharacterized protein LOC117824299 n=1 Tax=Notolabrus celidotus TaxID=1203425 RepID=UPI0014904DA3|nr:uncharacterized protein LOC117824299 [Notolabrus celidotus]